MADLRFQIALTNVSFDENYENVLRFETREEQEKFFDVSTLFSNAINVNFVARNLIDTQAFFRMPAGTSLVDMLTKNYAIVYDTQDDRYLYYFIKRIAQDDSNQVQLNLTLDVFQTFYIDTTFSDCLIERANLNRFVDNGDDTVSFDGTLNSKLFEREPVRNLSKVLQSRTVLPLYNEQVSDETAREWLANNVAAWIYVFLDPTHTYNIATSDSTTTTKFQKLYIKGANGENFIDAQIAAACVPILRDGYALNVAIKSAFLDLTVKMNKYAIRNFMDINNGASYVWAMKLSQVPPFFDLSGSASYPLSWSVSDDGLTLTLTAPFVSHTDTAGIIHSQYDKGGTYIQVTNTSLMQGMFCVVEQSANEVLSYTSAANFTFEKSAIIGAEKATEFNPKLLSADFRSLSVGDQNGNFEYDLQKLNHNDLSIIYTEPLVPDITRSYIRVQGMADTCYPEAVTDNYFGHVSQNDTSLVLTTTAYQTMIANNKNYFLQNAVNRWTNAGTSALASGAAIGTGLATGNVLGIVGGALGAIKSGVDLVKSNVNENLAVDNLKNAPSSMSNSQGSTLLNFQTSDLGVVVEEYDALPNEKQIANDYMDAYGFTYNRIDNIKNNDNIRHFHNYVQASVSEVTGVSNEIRQIFVDAFGRGVRFWNAANIQDKSNPFDYSMENYENWLAE